MGDKRSKVKRGVKHVPTSVQSGIRTAAAFPSKMVPLKMVPLSHHVTSESIMELKPSWSFAFLDHEDHPQWDWKFKGQEFKQVVEFLANMEQITWREIHDQMTSSKSGSHRKHHSMDMSLLCKDAQDRLRALELDEFGEIFRFRLGNKLRLWGILVPNTKIFCPVWWDTKHKVYPLDT